MDTPIQQQGSSSSGAPVEAVIAPGSTGLQESGAVVFPPPSTTTNLATDEVAELKATIAALEQRIQNLENN